MADLGKICVRYGIWDVDRVFYAAGTGWEQGWGYALTCPNRLACHWCRRRAPVPLSMTHRETRPFLWPALWTGEHVSKQVYVFTHIGDQL